MVSLRCREALDVADDATFGLGLGGVHGAVDAFVLQRREERRGVVPAHPVRPMEERMPRSLTKARKEAEVHWPDSTGRRNTLISEVCVGRLGAAETGSGVSGGQNPSPGRPTVAWREDRVRFWVAIARGVRMRQPRPVCRSLPRSAGSGMLACESVTCHRVFGRTSPCGGLRTSLFERSRADSGGAYRLSLVSCAATRRHGRTGWTTRPPSRSGMPSGARDVRRQRS